MMKTCTVCKRELPLTDFYKRARSHDGIDYSCKSCVNERRRLWASKNASKLKQHSEKYRLRRRDEAMDYLGGRVCTCGYSDVRALTIDHINGLEGNPRQQGIKIHNEILNMTETDAREKYQVLCWNCNWIKRMEGKMR